jgi:acetyltransferase-like isoleucine patch superfamily enzyme
MITGQLVQGENCWIGPYTIIDGVGGLTLGDFVHVSAGAQIYTHDTSDQAVTGGVAERTYAPTVIGDRCHIGANAVILAGVTLGSGSKVGAGAVVLAGEYPENSVLVGVPAHCKGVVV